MATNKKDQAGSFRKAAKKKPSMVRDFGRFFTSSGKWWLVPMIVVLLLLGGLFVLSSTVVAPFIYTLF